MCQVLMLLHLLCLSSVVEAIRRNGLVHCHILEAYIDQKNVHMSK